MRSSTEALPTPAVTRAEPLRILHVAEATLGGVRKYLENILHATSGSPGHYGIAYSSKRSDEQFPPLLDEMRARGWELFEIDMDRAVKPINDLKAVSSLRKIYRTFRPDVVHCHSSKAGAVGRAAARSLGRRRPVTVYSPHAIAANINGVYRAIEWGLGKTMTDVLVAVSDSEKRELSELNLVPDDRIIVIYPFVEHDGGSASERAAVRERLGIGQDGIMVLGIGRLTEQKDPIAFCDVVARAHAQDERFRGIWVGEGELRASVEEAIASKGLQDVVQLLGWQDEVAPYLEAADLFLSTARYESFGYVTAEALVAGLPVVASRVTGTTDLVEDRASGLLFDLGDHDAAASSLVRLVRDKELARALSDTGKERAARNLSREGMAMNLLEAYNEVRSRRKP